MRLRALLPIAGLLAGAAALPSPAQAATCSDYSNQAAAQAAGDTRDADGDGIYCESLPCPCSTGGGGSSSGGGTSGGSGTPRPTPKPKPKPKPKRHVPPPPGSHAIRAFYTPTRKSACVLFLRNTGSTFIECGVNSRATGYKLASIGRGRLAAWQDPLERFPGIAHKVAAYNTTVYARSNGWQRTGSDNNIYCEIKRFAGIRCYNPDLHGLRVSVQYRRVF
jgi:hypothetical protein